MKKTVCYQCTERHRACSDTCERRLAEKEQERIAYEARRIESEVAAAIYRSNEKAIIRAIKRRNKYRGSDVV